MQQQTTAKKEQTFLDVIAWIRTNRPDKVGEFLHYILCKGIELGMNAEYTDEEEWDKVFDLICDEYEATPQFVSVLLEQIENAREEWTPGANNPFKALIPKPSRA